MVDAIVNLIADIAEILTQVGNGLASNAQLVGQNPEFTGYTSIRVFWNLTMLPLTDKTGEMLNEIANILNGLIDFL